MKRGADLGCARCRDLEGELQHMQDECLALEAQVSAQADDLERAKLELAGAHAQMLDVQKDCVSLEVRLRRERANSEALFQGVQKAAKGQQELHARIAKLEAEVKRARPSDEG